MKVQIFVILHFQESMVAEQFSKTEVVFSSPQFIVTTAMSKSALLLQWCFCSCVLWLLLSYVTVFCTNCFIFSNMCDALSTDINPVKVENSFMNPVVVLLYLNYCVL